jgi:hypothetical protein
MPPKKTKSGSPAAPATPAFSLGRAPAFSLGAPTKATVKGGPINAPLPTGPIPGEPLPIEREAQEEFDELAGQFAHPKLSAAEFNQKKQKETERRERVSETTYWCGLVFNTTDDLNAFLAHVKGVSIEGQWLDGYEFASALGITITPTPLPEPRMAPLEQWADLALTVPEPAEASVAADFDPEFE